MYLSIENIGKNIVSMLIEINGLEVRDIGVDVPTDKIIAEAKDFGADVIGLSGLLTLAFDPMKAVGEKLCEEGLCDGVKVIIGGGQMDERVCEYVGADAFVTDAVHGVSRVKDWLAESVDTGTVDIVADLVISGNGCREGPEGFHCSVRGEQISSFFITETIREPNFIKTVTGSTVMQILTLIWRSPGMPGFGAWSAGAWRTGF